MIPVRTCGGAGAAGPADRRSGAGPGRGGVVRGCPWRGGWRWYPSDDVVGVPGGGGRLVVGFLIGQVVDRVAGGSPRVGGLAGDHVNSPAGQLPARRADAVVVVVPHPGAECQRAMVGEVVPGVDCRPGQAADYSREVGVAVEAQFVAAVEERVLEQLLSTRGE
jgi:hypothetical protein